MQQELDYPNPPKQRKSRLRERRHSHHYSPRPEAESVLFATPPDGDHNQLSVRPALALDMLALPHLSKLLDQSRSQDQHLLVSSFLVRGGPKAIANNLVYRYGGPALKNNLDSDAFYSSVITTACGVAFERLTYLWLSQKRNSRNTIILDNGSCNRLFGKIKRIYPGIFLPDGAAVELNDTPVLSAIYEYKMNPYNPKSASDLKRQIHLLEAFARQLAGRLLDIQRVRLDKKRYLTVDRIRVARNLQLILVVPQNRLINLEGSPIKVQQAPFPTGLVVEIAQRTLQDLDRLI